MSRISKLQEASTPSLYRRNAFRVLGLSLSVDTAGVREQQRELAMRKRLGLAAGDTNCGWMPMRQAPSAGDREKAQERLSQPEWRIVDELFWFWPRWPGARPDDAIEFIAGGLEADAEELWQAKQSDQRTTAVATHNLAVLNHLRALDMESVTKEDRPDHDTDQRLGYFRIALGFWARWLAGNGAWSFVRTRVRELDDPRLTTGEVRRLRKGLGTALLSINGQLALAAAEREDRVEARRHLKIIAESQLEDGRTIEIVRGCLNGVRERIKMLSQSATERANTEPEHGSTISVALLASTRPDIRSLRILLPHDDAVRQASQNEVARAVLEISISYANRTGDLRRGRQMLELAMPLACGPSLVERYRENIRTANELLRQ